MTNEEPPVYLVGTVHAGLAMKAKAGTANKGIALSTNGRSFMLNNIAAMFESR